MLLLLLHVGQRHFGPVIKRTLAYQHSLRKFEATSNFNCMQLQLESGILDVIDKLIYYTYS